MMKSDLCLSSTLDGFKMSYYIIRKMLFSLSSYYDHQNNTCFKKMVEFANPNLIKFSHESLASEITENYLYFTTKITFVFI